MRFSKKVGCLDCAIVLKPMPRSEFDWEVLKPEAEVRDMTLVCVADKPATVTVSKKFSPVIMPEPYVTEVVLCSSVPP